jgi:hypothetical protein
MPENKNDKYAVVKSWASDIFYDYELPSGQLCQLKKLQMEDLAKMNLVEMMDTFASLMAEPDASKKAKGKAKPKSVEEQNRERGLRLFENPERLAKVLETSNTVCIMAINQPKVHAAPADPEDRLEGVVYVDSIPFDDKIAVMNHVMDTLGGADSFPGQGIPVGDLEDGESVQLPSL